jgi:hypothetical protein
MRDYGGRVRRAGAAAFTTPGRSTWRRQLRSATLLDQVRRPGEPEPDYTFDALKLRCANDLARLGELTRSARERRSDPGQLPQIAQTYADLAVRCPPGTGERAELLALAASTWSLAGYQANAAALADTYLREIRAAEVPSTDEPRAGDLSAKAIPVLVAVILARDVNAVADLGAAARGTSREIEAMLLAEARRGVIDDGDAAMLAVYGLTGRAARRLSQFWRTGMPEAAHAAIQDVRTACTLLLHAGVVDTWVLMDNLACVVEDVVATSPWRLLRRATSWNGLWRQYLRVLVAADRPVVQVWPSQQRVLEAGLLERDRPNLTVTMPTSAGKTHLAEWAILHALAGPARTKALPLTVYLVPSRALAAQVERDLEAHLAPLGIRMSALFGGFEHASFENHLVAGTDVLVATSEKFDLLLRNDPTVAQRLELLILDEGHLLGDDERGLRLELVLTRVRRTVPAARILLLSAVLPNPHELARWLDPAGEHLAEVDWSPSRLRMGVFTWRGQDRAGQHGFVEYRATDVDTAFFLPYLLTRSVPKRTALYPKDRKDIAAELAVHYQRLGPVLISIPTKPSVSATARAVAGAAKAADVRFGADTDGALPGEVVKERARLLTLIDEYCGSGHELAELVMAGIGYHHADVPEAVRHALERAYRRGALRVLCATSTLSQGVNLPTKTVLVCGTMRNREPLTIRDFLNTAGRAGRPFRESEGHVILVATNEREAAELRSRYLDFPQLEPVESRLVQLYHDLVNARLDEVRVGDTHPALLLDPAEQTPQDAVLQALDFQLLAALTEEAVDTQDEDLIIDAVRTVLGDTLAAVQLGAELIEAGPVRRVAAHRVRAVIARVPDPQLRAAFLRTGLSLAGNEDALRAAQELSEAIEQDPDLLDEPAWRRLRELAVTQACTIREARSSAERSGIAVTAIPALAMAWMDGAEISLLRSQFADVLGVADPMRFAAVLDRLMTRDLAWALSALVQLLESACAQSPTPELAALPAMAKYGVNSPAACYAASIGVRNRRDAIALGESCPPGAALSFRAFLHWATALAPEDTIGLSPETLARLAGHAASLQTPRELLAFVAERTREIDVPFVPSGHRHVGDPTGLLTDGQRLHLRREREHTGGPNTIAVCTSVTGAAVGYFDPVYARVLAPLMDTDGLPTLTATYIAQSSRSSERQPFGPHVRVRADRPRATHPAE